MSLATIQDKIRKAACPSCSTRASLDSFLRCDLGTRSCVLMAQCEKCQLTLEIEDYQHLINAASTEFNIYCDQDSHQLSTRPAKQSEKEEQQAAVPRLKRAA